MSEKRSRIQLPKDEYKKLCIAVLTRDGWRCRCCRSRQNLHVHHIIFRSQGGDDADWNLITLCLYCHDALHRPANGKCIVVESRTGREIIDANDKKDLTFRRINGWKTKWTPKAA